MRDHVSGQLKVAPEHCASGVLACMGKPDFSVYEKFRRKYFRLCEECGKEQYLVPYLMSSHPGSTLEEAIELALCLKRDHYAPEQVQDYYPTPGTASTVMFYTGINPLTMKHVHVVTDYHEKLLQRALLQYNRPESAELVREALIKAHREDLIGFGPECLVRPAAPSRGKDGRPPKGVGTRKPSARGADSDRPAAGSKKNARSQAPHNPARVDNPTRGGHTAGRGKPVRGRVPTAPTAKKPASQKRGGKGR